MYTLRVINSYYNSAYELKFNSKNDLYRYLEQNYDLEEPDNGYNFEIIHNDETTTL